MSTSGLTNKVVILSAATSTADENARKIVEFAGAEAIIASLATTGDRESTRQLISSAAVLIVHADTLAWLAETLDTGLPGLAAWIESAAAHVFVYGFEPTERHASILRALSSGRLLGVAPLTTEETRFHVADGHRQWCGQFSGLSIEGADPSRDSSFIEGTPQKGQSVLMRVGRRTLLVRIDRGRSDIFLVACRELANLDEEVPDKVGLLPWFSRLVPLMIFLRRALGNRIWHSHNPRACVIIDDPLLKPRHGFLEYKRLLKAMSQYRFSTCIAFIPWNYRRSRRQIADLFFNGGGALSLCVHGCDHTGSEFNAAGFEVLRSKARLALDRMQVHSRLSGVGFHDVMVFPQGRFSPEAMQALDACGYLAAVNTELHPVKMPEALTLRDQLDVAITAFADFPLFARHYPRDSAEFAFDLFLGKPALIVEHHGYFRNGYEPLGTFARQLNDLDARLEWSNLTTICSRACLKRVAPQGDIHVRFFASRFSLTNHEAQSRNYVFFRRRAWGRPLPVVTVNGHQWPCEQKDGNLMIRLSLNPEETANIRIVSNQAAAFSWKPNFAYQAKVFARRILCECRDNYVDTNRVLARLMSISYTVRGAMKKHIG